MTEPTASPLETLLGPSLLFADGKTVDTTSALRPKTAVGLYFSAHWCPPCRRFTPQLAQQYKKLAKELKLPFEIVFVSSDRDESTYDEYRAEQPWLALPYAARDTKAKLSKKYKVSGIPTLVILDGATGELITKEGREQVMADADGSAFPWKPPPIWECLGDEFLRNDGETVELDDIRGAGKAIGLYFSASWCGPCHAFTPELVKTYNKLKEQGTDFEIVFVSSDRDTASFQKYFSSMPWLAIPPGDRRKALLSTRFEVAGIPTFVMLDGNGETINLEGRRAVGEDPEGVDFPWHPKAVASLSSPDGINDEASLCLFADGCSSAEQEELREALTPIAEESKAAGKGTRFFIATDREDDVTGQVRQLLKLGEPTAKAKVVLLDIPDEGGFYVMDAEPSADTIQAFLKAYEGGELERKQLQE